MVDNAREQPFGSRYLLGDPLGRGATGQVYRGRDREGGPAVAVKLLRDELAEQPDIAVRFVHERQLLRRLSHPNVVQVHDLVMDGDRLGIVMDLVDGDDLRRAIPRLRGTDEALDLVAQVAEGLAAIHAVGVVHLDVKPENILLHPSADGRLQARLTDFGIARLLGTTATRTMSLTGTPGYIAPEVGDGCQAGAAADVYALGVVLYELCAGRAPFRADGLLALLRAHAEQAPARPEGIPTSLWDLLQAMLAKNPDARPTAAEVARRLRAVTRQGVAKPIPSAQPDICENDTLIRGPRPAGTFGGAGAPSAVGDPGATSSSSARRWVAGAAAATLAAVASVVGYVILVGTRDGQVASASPMRSASPAPTRAGAAATPRVPQTTSSAALAVSTRPASNHTAATALPVQTRTTTPPNTTGSAPGPQPVTSSSPTHPAPVPPAPIAPTMATPPASDRGSRLTAGQALRVGEKLTSDNGRAVLVVETSGKVVVYGDTSRVLKVVSSKSCESCVLEMQRDGNLVAYATGHSAVCSSGTEGNPDTDLEIQNDGNLVLYAPGHRAIWSSDTFV